MFDKLKKLLGLEPPPPPPEKKPRKTRKPRESKPQAQPSPKESATLRGEPWVEVQQFELDPNDIHTGNFVIDFNDKFVLNLVKAGYKQKETDTDYDIVDRWFTDICRSVVLEHHEQVMADPQLRSDLRIIRSRDIGGGRSEVS